MSGPTRQRPAEAREGGLACQGGPRAHGSFPFFDLSFLFLFFVFFLISVLKFYSVHIELCIELLIKVQIQNTKSSMYTIYSYTFILNVLSIYLGKTFQI